MNTQTKGKGQHLYANVIFEWSLAEPLESVDACGSAVAVGVLPGVHEEVVVARLLEVLEVAVRLRRREDTHEPRRLR